MVVKELLKLEKESRLHIKERKTEADDIKQIAINSNKVDGEEIRNNFKICFWKMPLDHFKTRFNQKNHHSWRSQCLQLLFLIYIRSHNYFPINHKVPSIEEIQRHQCQLKSGKASNDIDAELLKKCEPPIMLEVLNLFIVI